MSTTQFDGRRWRAKPLRTNEWTKWFDQQLAASNKKSDQGLYIGLRMDGRVRASGGCRCLQKYH